MFCKHCGNQLPDEARFCWACGNEIAPLPTVEPTIEPATAPVAEPVAPAEKKESTFPLIFAFICKVFAIFSATFCGCALAESRGELLTYWEIKRYINSDLGIYLDDLPDGLHVRHLWNEGCATISLITAIIALTLALSWLIYTIAKRRQCQYILSAITWVLAAGGLLAVSICLAG